jgi:hypothetical protein
MLLSALVNPMIIDSYQRSSRQHLDTYHNHLNLSCLVHIYSNYNCVIWVWCEYIAIPESTFAIMVLL